MSWGETHRIETPEQIDFNLEIAGPGARFFAQFIDWLVKWAITFLFLLGLLSIASVLGSKLDFLDGRWHSEIPLLAFAVAMIFVFYFGYDIYFEGVRNGQTPGKKYGGIRVVRDTGGPIDVTAAFIRNIVGLADFLPSFYIGGGLICMLNKRGQRLGDMAAGTVVIRERATPSVLVAEPNIGRHASAEFSFTAEQLAKCTPEDQHVLRSFFTRFADMESDPRRALAERLFKIFIEKTGYTPTTPIVETHRQIGFLAALHRDIIANRQ